MSDLMREELRAIKTFPSLVKYLRDELDWPVEAEDFEDLTFEYEPEELGIDPSTAAKINEIKQLRPLATNQPWGIFFIKFEPKSLPVVVLRRILSKLVVKKRTSANKSDQAVWNLHDLLFISNYGEGDQRQITFAHFSQDEVVGDLPTLKVLGWDDSDTALHLDHVHQELKTKLCWPDNEKDLKGWREQWSSAFILRNREVITTSQELAIRLAGLAQRIRSRVNRVLAVETARGPMRKLYNAFQQALIHDLKEDDFADMYAQTIAYGLLAARFSRPMGIVVSNITDMVPNTNPFLRDMLSTFITTGGRQGKIDFDELGIQEVVELLNSPDTHMDAVLLDFGNRTRQEDPVIHFYELFLSEYDKKKKVERGVFYTPQSVVSYIVRSVHELLQKEFGLEDGLADITTWGEISKRNKNIKIPDGVSFEDPFVQVLDPAVGTATFLVEVIDIIQKSMTSKWKKQGRMALEFPQLWNEYVPKHLLPRLYGFELMMAPYAIAHMRLGLKLDETGYRFGKDTPRANIYLTNSLEPASDATPERVFELLAPALANEAKAVNLIKGNKYFTVILGNPPYSRDSKNQSPFIEDLMNRYKKAVRNERNIQPLNDDYIKFFCLAQYYIEKTGIGMVNYISNNKYLSGSTIHRGIREEITSCFGLIQITNLHGDVGHPTDRNVFDIREGVTISTLVRLPSCLSCNIIQYRECFGSRVEKYDFLLTKNTQTPDWISVPLSQPQLFFIPMNAKYDAELDTAVSVATIFGKGLDTDKGKNWGNGVKTNRDNLLIADTRDELIHRFGFFENKSISDDALANQLNLTDGPYWNTARERRKILAQPWRSKIVPYCYRPFYDRWILYRTDLMEIGRGGASKHVMKHMLRSNLGLVTHRTASKQLDYTHFFAVNTLIDVRTFPDREGVPYLFPLYVYPNDSNQQSLHSEEMSGRQPNLNPSFLNTLASKLHLQTTKPYNMPEGISPENIFNYAYAVFYSPSYRNRYSDLLKVDFPRLPLTPQIELFHSLSDLGGELVTLHLMESSKLNTPITRWQGSTPSNEIEKVTYFDNTVWIEKGQNEGFHSVPENVWNFDIGGYQVCEKWLKECKGRSLTAEDIAHYQKIIVAINETIKLMAEIDKVIDQHGGWPGAFV